MTVVLYLAFLPLWWYSLKAIATVAGVAANWIYGFMDPRVSIVPDGRIIRVFVNTSAIGDAQTTSTGLRLDMVTYGLPLLAALIIVTRANSIVAKIRTLLVGLGVMLALTVPAVMAFAQLTSLKVDEKAAPGSADTSSLLFDAFHGYAFSQPVLAVAVWLALIMFGSFRGKSRQTTPAVPIPRNAACPCGSGRRYKKCCGAG